MKNGAYIISLSMHVTKILPRKIEWQVLRLKTLSNIPKHKYKSVLSKANKHTQPWEVNHMQSMCKWKLQ